jgi:hypothetical protein
MTDEQRKLIELNAARVASVLTGVGPVYKGKVIDDRGGKWKVSYELIEVSDDS